MALLMSLRALVNQSRLHRRFPVPALAASALEERTKAVGTVTCARDQGCAHSAAAFWPATHLHSDPPLPPLPRPSAVAAAVAVQAASDWAELVALCCRCYFCWCGAANERPLVAERTCAGAWQAHEQGLLLQSPHTCWHAGASAGVSSRPVLCAPELQHLCGQKQSGVWQRSKAHAQRCCGHCLHPHLCLRGPLHERARE